MPRRSILSVAERESLLALPDNRDDLIRRYTLSPSDLPVIQQRRYAPELLSVLGLHAAPAAKPVLDAIELLREMNAGNARKLPDDAPVEFIRERWAKLILTEGGLDRRYYELCALAELKNALRSGEIWVEGSRQFKNFNEYMVPAQKFAALKEAQELALAIDPDCEEYLQIRLAALHEELHRVDQLAAANDLPDAILTDSGLKITPLDAMVPQAAQNVIEQVAASLPHVKHHRTASGSRQLDRLHKQLHSPEEWRGSQGPHNSVNDDPCRCNQSRPDQDGRIVSRYELREALVAAGLAHTR